MSSRRIKVRAILLICCAAFAGPLESAHADWKMHPATEYDEEVRVWAAPKEMALDFSWSGKVNSRHEAEGYGILEWADLKDGRKPTSVYTGEMKAGRRDGFGVSLHRSGSKYSGQWRNNVKEGKGEYWYANGDYYSGEFSNDRMHGPGRYVSAGGTVFEGTFSADEREGPGVVIYPDGHRYTSTWSAGKDINPAGAPVLAKPYMLLGVDVRRYALDGQIFSEGIGSGDELYLTYRGRQTDGDFVIEPDWQYWVAWSKGGPVVTRDDASGDFDLGVLPVFLDVRVFNPGRESLAIRRAEAVVEESFPDLEPILRLQDASAGSGGVTCEIVNFGSSRVDDCEIAFNILPPDAEPEFANYQFVEKLGSFSERATFSLARAMEALGIDSDAIAAVEQLDYDDPSRESVALRARQEILKFPKFVESAKAIFSASGLIAGEIRLVWTDHLGSQQTKRVKFLLNKRFCLFWAEGGAGGPPSGSYDLHLESEGSDYVVPFAYKRTIAPGANDRFTLQVASEVSTYQNFYIRLTTADGREIISPRCRTHFLVPRNFSWKEGYVIEEQGPP
ncbi:MAG: hypothetical protein WBL40_10150 [Terrimicrobiaceae bacterium]